MDAVELNQYEILLLKIHALADDIHLNRVRLNISHTEIYEALEVTQQTYLVYRESNFRKLSIEQLITVYQLFAKVEREPPRPINPRISNHHKNACVKMD